MRYLISILLVLTFATTPAFAQEAPDASVATDVAAPAPVADEASPATPEVVVGDPVVTPDPVTPEVANPAAPVTPEADADPKVPETDEEAGALISQLLDAANNGHWTVFGGLLILLLVFFFNRLGLAAKIGTKWVPWVTLGTGAAVGVAVGLVDGAALGDAFKLGLLEGGLAIALWELVVKHVTSNKSDGEPRVAPESAEA